MSDVRHLVNMALVGIEKALKSGEFFDFDKFYSQLPSHYIKNYDKNTLEMVWEAAYYFYYDWILSAREFPKKRA